ncbi:hypothetical protein JS756_16620 [Streptomyces actuosus]|uniref:Uncharacterized protein n=1 Tax=Streptomyces actuosus TaxID=1885 RepID=A0ABS2VRK2_STRAS|nr:MULTISPECIES: hypothetical protein [Streptomyces]KOV54600.1 hypothetical protein ADL00_29970 [Streptomyces sp. AS58]MBN0045701.1 hypothetical protein [Streptomyces actuosus]
MNLTFSSPGAPASLLDRALDSAPGPAGALQAVLLAQRLADGLLCSRPPQPDTRALTDHDPDPERIERVPTRQ